MKKLGFSSNHLSNVFKQQYGYSPIDYINQKRVEYAKELLKKTDITIVNIAADIGFESLCFLQLL